MAGPRQKYSILDLGKGLINKVRNPLAYPADAIASGLNVELAGPGMIRTRRGFDTCGTVVPGLGAWTKQSPAAAQPLVHEDATVTYDPINEQFFTFGGSQWGTYNNQIWKYVIATNAWTQLSPTGGPPHIRGRHTATYIPSLHSILVYGGYTALAGADIWKYNIALNTWTLLKMHTAGIDRLCHSAIYDGSDALYFYGGQTSAVAGVYVDSTVLTKYNITANTFETVTAVTGRPTVKYHTACYVPDLGVMLVHGGQNGAGVFQSALYSYNIATPAWTTLSPTGTVPCARYGSTTVWDTVSAQMLVGSGIGDDGGGGALNLTDVWGYSPYNNKWTTIAAQGLSPAAPTARYGNMLGFEMSDTPRIWIFCNTP